MRDIVSGDYVLIGGQWGCVESLIQPKIVFNDGSCLYNFALSDIKTIRKPRPGGKEARDIVAKILKRALNFRRKIGENILYRLIHEVTIGDYEIAKYMLKDQS